MSDSDDAEAQSSSTANLAEGKDGKSDSKKKLIRLLTVMAYVSSVSGTAFMLSMYYLFLWEPKVAEHHLKSDPMGHQALALKGHGEHGQRGYHDGLYDGYLSPYRPPGTADSRVLGGMYPVGSSPSGGYRSAAPPMGPPVGLPMGPPMGTPGRPRYDYQYQDSVPVWSHSAYAPQPPRPPSLSQVLEPSDSLLVTRLTALTRVSRAGTSTTTAIASAARNSTWGSTTPPPQTDTGPAHGQPSSPLASPSPLPALPLSVAMALEGKSGTLPPSNAPAPSSTPTLTSTPTSTATSTPTSTASPRRAPPGATRRHPTRKSATLPAVGGKTTRPPLPVTTMSRNLADGGKSPPLVPPGTPGASGTTGTPGTPLSRPSDAPPDVPTRSILAASVSVVARQGV